MIICPNCNGTGLHRVACRQNCPVCCGMGLIDDLERERVVKNVECNHKDDDGLDWPGMSRDLAIKLSRANRNIDLLISTLIDTIEIVHNHHRVGSKQAWHDCVDYDCKRVSNLMHRFSDYDKS